MSPPRRIVSGLDRAGRSCILIDGPSENVIWSTEASPVDNSGEKDAGGIPFGFDIPAGGSRLVFNDFAPGRAGSMHATDTIDYVIIVSGEISFITETGETLLRAGDVVVDRGVNHAWRNDGALPCRMMVVLLPAHPVGKGATV